MLHQPFQRLVAKIESVPTGVAPLQPRHQPQGVGVMLEPAIGRHAFVQHVLAGMAKTGVAEIVRQRRRLGQVFVEVQPAREGAGNLRHLDRMGEAGAKMIAFERNEHLGFTREAAEGRG